MLAPKKAEEAPKPSMVCLVSAQSMFTSRCCWAELHATKLAETATARARGWMVLIAMFSLRMGWFGWFGGKPITRCSFFGRETRVAVANRASRPIVVGLLAHPRAARRRSVAVSNARLVRRRD